MVDKFLKGDASTTGNVATDLGSKRILQSSTTVYNTFVKKCLQGDTSIKTHVSVALRKDSGVSFDEKKYIPWTVPTLADDNHVGLAN